MDELKLILENLKDLKVDLKEVKVDLAAVRETTIRLETKEEKNLRDVEKLQDEVRSISETKIPALREDIATLKTKASVWGGIVAMFVSFFVALSLKIIDFIRN